MDRVYLDTSGWNALLDWVEVRSPKCLRGHEYLFSSCDLDEFGLAPSSRASALAAFAWRMCTRRKLRDHLELTAEELLARERRVAPDYFDADPGFIPAWRMLKDVGVTNEWRAAVSPDIEAAKREYREHLRLQRELFAPYFRRAAELGLRRGWSSLLDEFEQGEEVPTMIEALLCSERLLPRRRANACLDFKSWHELPGTACWVQYHLALEFSAAFGTRGLGAAERGDQFDYRYASYAGIVDVFVTADERMYSILTSMVRARRVRVLRPLEYIAECSGRSL